SGTVTIDGTHNNFRIKVDGAASYTTITLTQGAGRTLGSIAAELNANPGLAGATASLDSSGKLVITSNTTGTSSSIDLAEGTSNGALSRLGFTATANAGTAVNNGYGITASTNDKVYVSVNGGATQTF